MKTAGQVVESAFRLILAENADSPIEADEYADGIAALNAMMAAHEVLGIRLGYTEVANVGDFVTVPDGAVLGVISNLALDLAGAFAINPDQSVAAQAARGLSAMRRLGLSRIQASYPNTLPVGSGNRGPAHNNVDAHYSGGDATALLVLAGNTMVTEFGALATPVKVKGEWQAAQARQLRVDITGRVTNVTAHTFNLRYEVDARATGDGGYRLLLMRNGREVAATSAALTAAGVAFPQLAGSLELQAWEYLELYMEAATATNDAIAADVRLRVW
jgi:hypothetical protein